MRGLRWLVWIGMIPRLWAQLPIEVLPAGSAPDQPGWHERSLEHDGLTRWFLVYVPEDLPPRPPAVVLLHGGTGGMRGIFSTNQSTTRQWPYIAEREKLLLYVPNGVNPDTGDTYGDEQNWNDLRAPGSERDSDADDVGFLWQVIDHAVRTGDADPLRVYFTGSSNGGTMSMRVAMEMPGRLAAAAIAIANLPVDEIYFTEPARPVPFLFCNGTEDPLMVYDGVPGDKRSAPETVAWWIERNHADPVPEAVSYLPDLDPDDQCVIECRDYPALPGGAPISFLTVEGGGHVTPSIDHHIPNSPLIIRLIGRQCHDIETAEVQWEFLSQFAIPLDPVLKISAVEAGPFHLELKGGHPAGHAVLEASPSLDHPQWTEIGSTTLDDFGSANFTAPLSGEPRRFFQVRTEPEGPE